ncbi:cytochrome b6/f complex iron-sulfur subunit precursor [Cyanidioschyzon merolae strain 10D]|uniref:plastoquinol--plastocyanin reductase n=1 Tax=Cyanidioschyzon merolae (strain NIES-3377 / 10D) TaxID=280699 RepID=M1VET8_CYAM1|nr:cytochrome b6/f complex iron-sulfur subunit precursor [Cyanidioschyzon merolae strain 10D]BAM81447.1 cytochrome b6/f complex iron-sulfur subunit precursor [Cyanidioschyzon merolae strain 10D]|eukprot:XP_005537483.1 cytochrome b6/f complex iron-sulfur subunit precursor [Cyanidioschyzon merolae strain 10D]
MFVLTTNSLTFRTVPRCYPGTVERQHTTLGRKRVALRMTYALPSTVDNARGGSGSGGDGGGSSGSDDDYIPDMGKRTLLSLILLGSVGLPASIMLSTYASYFMPPSKNKSSGGVIAKDALGTPIKKEEYLKTHPPGSRDLVQGLNGEPTYLVVNDAGELETYALNAVCTHLGCVVPWYAAQNKFICPCHGSQYDRTGKVVRGPAPLPLALAHTKVDDDGFVQIKPWKETDFRTGEKPWWK